LDKSIIYYAKLHWVIFLGPLLLLMVALIAGSQIQQLWEASLFIVIFTLFWLGMTWITYYFSSLTIKQKQIILRTGMLVRKTVDIPLNKIESIDIRQTILGSIFGFGSIVIIGTGGTRHVINNLSKPLTCRRHIEQLMHEQ
jgi:uncharacterized membrane protein YdbT with pleckstrin-like domain